MELAMKRNAMVFLAHDDRVPRPVWLAQQFKTTGQRLLLNDAPMTIFQYHAAANESLTLGANSDTGDVKSCNMYVVFVNVPPGVYADRKELSN
jgi:beta-galactosidase